MVVITVLSGSYDKKIVMKTFVVRYVLYFQLFIYAIFAEVEVKYEIMNKEATESQLAISKIVTNFTEGTKNRTTEFTSLNYKAENITKQNNDTGRETTMTVYQSTVKMDRNTTAATGLVDVVTKESINKLISKHGDEYKNFRHYRKKPKHLDFFYSFNTPNKKSTLKELIDRSQENETKIKYILQWTKNDSLPFTKITSIGQKAFLSRSCVYTNCVVIKRNSFIVDYEIFDAVVFFAKDLSSSSKHSRAIRKLIKKRLPHQKYVFASLDYWKVQRIEQYNNFFNWTWTYKLNSDLAWPPFVVKDVYGNVVAPDAKVRWMKKEEMSRVSEDIMNILVQKSMPIILFYPCNAVPTRTFYYVRTLIRFLKVYYGLYVDKINMCWYKYATEDVKALISKVIRRNYYFYLSFENNEGEDYVPDNLIQAINNFAVPIVFEGANYSRFLPDHSYLDATEFTPHALGREINLLLRDSSFYAEYFKWINHYSIHRPEESLQTDHICRMCELMNNNKKLNEITVYKNFTDWWSKKYRKIKKVKKEFDYSVPYIPSYNSIEEIISRPKPEKQSVAEKIIRKSAKVYTSIIDTFIGGVKSAFSTLLG